MTTHTLISCNPQRIEQGRGVIRVVRSSADVSIQAGSLDSWPRDDDAGRVPGRTAQSLPTEGHVDRAALRRLGRDIVVGLKAAQVVPEADTAPEEDRSNADVQSVNQAGLEEVARHGDSTADANILTTGSVKRSLKSLLRGDGEEVERRAAGLLDRRSGCGV